MPVKKKNKKGVETKVGLAEKKRIGKKGGMTDIETHKLVLMS